MKVKVGDLVKIRGSVGMEGLDDPFREDMGIVTDILIGSPIDKMTGNHKAAIIHWLKFDENFLGQPDHYQPLDRLEVISKGN